MNKIFVLSIAFLGAGCNPFAEFKPNSGDIVTSGWAKNREKLTEKPLYCYATLGESMCYTQPLAHAEDRLSGHYHDMNAQAVPTTNTMWDDVRDTLEDLSGE